MNIVGKIICLASVIAMTATNPASAQSTLTLTIDGDGSGSLNGTPFSSNSFSWVLSYTTNNPNTYFSDTQPIYTLLSSELTLSGDATPINITESEGLYVSETGGSSFYLAPIRMSGTTPTGNILTLAGSPYWDGVSPFTSTSISMASFNQFIGIATDQGTLDMGSGTVSLVMVAVPEPSTLALAGFGGLSLLLYRRRK